MDPFTTTVITVLLALRARRRRRSRVRTMYMRPIFWSRLTQGESHLVDSLRLHDPYYHQRYFRMNKDTFDKILEKVEDRIYTSRTHACPISSLTRLAITLRYLATGSSQIQLALSFHIAPSAVSQILPQVMKAICECMASYISKPDEDGWKKIEEGYSRRWNYPNCVGAIDGKHIRIQQPPGSGSQFYNYKNFYSIVLMAIVDSRCRFTLFEHGASGSCSDSGTLKNSIIGRKLEKGKYKFPPEITLSEGKSLPPVIVGDEGFSLKPYLMKPYSGRHLGLAEKVYNYRHSRARMTSENAFGILAARWRIFHTKMECSLELANLVVKTTVLLHNFLIDENDLNGLTVDTDINGEISRGNWRECLATGVFPSLARHGSNNASQDAFHIRDTLKEHFMSTEGGLSWQVERAMRGYE